MCERFDCLPSQAQREWDRHGWQLEAVMEALAVADVWSQQQAANGKKDLEPKGDFADLVRDVKLHRDVKKATDG